MSAMLGRLVQTTARDGVRLDGFLAETKQGSNQTWILLHGVNGNFYSGSLLKDIASGLVERGDSILLANTRGHDLCSHNTTPVPRRIGSMYERLAESSLDLVAWHEYVTQEMGTGIGFVAHSLGAVKMAHTLRTESLAITHAIALSPPRLNTELLLRDPKRGQHFQRDLELAKEHCDRGEFEHVMKVRFPLPNWVSAATYLDKYGSGDAYDYLLHLEKIVAPSLWVFGQTEVDEGSVNFRDADKYLRSEISKLSQENRTRHQVSVVPMADHSYTGQRDALMKEIVDWLDRSSSR